ncbi:MAG TPA: hypothetical protein VGN21_19220 [Stellaceae bacterium]|jgi:hypothetical protein
MMRLRRTYALLGVLLAAGPIFPAAAQLASPCAAFQRDRLGAWNATEPVTVDSDIGFIDITPGHAVTLRLARILDARCR